ncbi:precorrin-6Y C5,15-methyltransferase (decarboxylating) [Breoghania corrubedonensis]|uniref:Precorrin-6Y C5,15-methyltransferase (Decarboxylating) n=1 Tax=Breoghania corrubedonensis TaxID=665038 RepID=A0A2T5VFY1_9HYPH|nr:precorrin-6y C5,15-methyltransferase (decarboxylating) subunit CbiE [Breoghania corrubedonensis]PTW62667.1 precorrin-6Y C5,15-methyltransferase (decarboxylating) [Breoghania corrubedonensis]
MTAPWLTVIGLGEDGVDGVSAVARRLLADAEIVYGGRRHLDLAGSVSAEKRPWPSPLAAGLDEIEASRGRRVVVLATGDPMWFGIGATLARRIPADQMRVLPAPSAFQLAAARMGWPLAEVETVTLHGRPAERLKLALVPGARILALTVADSPRTVAAMLTDAGYGDSPLVALEHLGGPSERRVEGLARDWDFDVAPLHTLAIECVAGSDALLLPRVPGLPDEAFRHDGKMTKREVRALTLARLMPLPDALLWDIGAGCGSVAIEWMRAAPRAHAIAIEPRADRRAIMAENALALGVPDLDIRDGTAPDALEDLRAPDAIFIGGGLSKAVFEASFAALKPGGRLVANAVTLESEAILLALHASHGGDLVRLAVSRASAVGSLTGWRPAMPVTQWSLVKSRGYDS